METSGPTRADTREPILYLGSDGELPFEVDANTLATGRTCIIGASGSGKSYAVGVMCEELCKSQVPFAIVDTEGEHSGLKEKYEVVLVGDDGACDLQWSSLDLGQLASQAPDIAPLILDVSETEGSKEKIGELLTRIYEEVERRRTPYLIVVEEADRFMPQNGERVPIFGEVARRGRKRGIGLMVCTQRPSLVDKNILSQCGNQLIGKLVIKNDLQAVAQFFSGHELPKYLTTLQPGRFFAMGGLSAAPRLVTIRKMDTSSGGSTPQLGTRVVKQFSPAVMAALRRSTKPGKGSTEGLVGINPAFSAEDVPTIVKRDKSLIFFGKEEVVANAQLIFRPLVEIGVAVKTGMIKKRIEMRYLILDGQTGKSVELRDTPTMYEGLERLTGLNSQQIEVLRTTSPDKDMSLLEIANKVGVSKEMLRRPVRLLEEKRLIRSFQVGKSRVFRRIFSFPEFPWHESERSLERVDVSKAKVEEYKLDEERIREVIKGVISYSDVQSFKRFVYPLYRVELIMKRRKRVVWLDGQTGKEIHP
jgi:DNA-binding Lrp family transcriptional regulator